MAKPIAETWYGIDPCPGGVLRVRETHVDPYMSGDIWLVRGAERDLVVDSGMGILPPGPVIAGLSEKPILAVALCSYYDHAGGMIGNEHVLTVFGFVMFQRNAHASRGMHNHSLWGLCATSGTMREHA